MESICSLLLYKEMNEENTIFHVSNFNIICKHVLSFKAESRLHHYWKRKEVKVWFKKFDQHVVVVVNDFVKKWRQRKLWKNIMCVNMCIFFLQQEIQNAFQRRHYRINIINGSNVWNEKSKNKFCWSHSNPKKVIVGSKNEISTNHYIRILI